MTIISELFQLNLFFDFLFKISSLLVLFFFYIKRTKSIHIGYILVFLLLLITDILVVYDLKFFEEMVVIKFINSCVFIALTYEVLKKRFFKSILKYFFIHLAIAGVIYVYVISEIKYLSFLVTLTYVSICLLSAVTFVNLTFKNNKKAIFYFVAVFLFSSSNLLFGLSYYIEKSMIYLPFVYVLRLVAEYYFYYFMIEKDRKKITF